MFIFRNWKMTG